MQTLFGNTTGLKSAQSRRLRALYRRRVDKTDLISPTLARALTELSRETGRRIAVLVDRSGEIDKVIIGDAHRVFLPDLGAKRAGADRFRGVRLVHTSLRPEGLTEDDLTDLSLLQLDAVATIHVLDDGLPGALQYATLLPPEADKNWRIEDVRSVYDWDADWLAIISDLEAQFARSPRLKEIEQRPGAILVGLTLRKPDRARRSLAELERLAETAGFRIIDSVLARRDKLDGRTVIGSGKLQELVVRSMHTGAEALVFDRELSPSQLRNIAQSMDLKVLDRTQLILDIFAQHAQSKAGKLQIELAQLRYRMPRLKLMPTAMSRLTGGIGGRGPGETKLEINRRRANERLARLEKQLDKVASDRELRRRRRQKNRVPVVSIVGYTNAGKSTLLNQLTRSEVIAEDKLFATLDPTSRRFRFPEEREILITDTVGFIHDLPNTLVQAFKATLEELDEADLLLHVLDASDPNVEHHKASVEAIVEQLDLDDKPVVLVWNKADATHPEVLNRLTNEHGGLPVSAVSGQGLERLLDHIERQLFRVRDAHASSDEAARAAGK